MNKHPQLSRDIGGDRKAKHSVASLFVVDVSDELLLSSFYLPRGVMTRDDVTIEPPVVLTWEEFFTLEHNSQTPIFFDGESKLVRQARFVAISKRTSTQLGGTWYVAKVWYGEKP